MFNATISGALTAAIISTSVAVPPPPAAVTSAATTIDLRESLRDPATYSALPMIPRAPAQAPRQTSTAKRVAKGLAGAVILGAAGAFGGAIVGGTIENKFSPCNCDDPGLLGAIRGFFIGGAIGIFSGAYLFGK